MISQVYGIKIEQSYHLMVFLAKNLSHIVMNTHYEMPLAY